MKDLIKEILSIPPARFTSWLIVTIFTGNLLYQANIHWAIISIIYAIVSIILLFERPFRKVIPLISLLITLVIASTSAVTISQFDEGVQIHRIFLLSFFVLFAVLSIGYHKETKNGDWLYGMQASIVFNLVISLLTQYLKKEIFVYVIAIIVSLVITLGTKFLLRKIWKVKGGAS